MPQLNRLRQKIKVVEKIYKITHAMRLISMSLHAKLRLRAESTHNYKQRLTRLFGALQAKKQDWDSPILNPIINSGKSLIILIGSQKGLCGGFNSKLFQYFTIKMENENPENIDLIAVGKKSADFLKKKHSIFKTFEAFTTTTLNTLTEEIYKIIINANKPYKNVFFYYNYPKSFLNQKPVETQLIPTPKVESKAEKLPEDLVWEEPIEEVLNFLAKEYLRFIIQTALFDSLLSEQASRFQSMDNATRNADSLLEGMKKQYAKQRQAKITKELIELVGAFQA